MWFLGALETLKPRLGPIAAYWGFGVLGGDLVQRGLLSAPLGFWGCSWDEREASRLNEEDVKIAMVTTFNDRSQPIEALLGSGFTLE